MPLRVPVGALSIAHRIMCMRVVTALAAGNEPEDWSFEVGTSKKCAYCTAQQGLCNPVSSNWLVLAEPILTRNRSPTTPTTFGFGC